MGQHHDFVFKKKMALSLLHRNKANLSKRKRKQMLFIKCRRYKVLKLQYFVPPQNLALSMRKWRLDPSSNL